MMLVASLGISQAATLVTELSPLSTGITTTSATIASAGISTSDVFNYTTDEWHFTHENSSLAGQSSAVDSSIQLQIGAAASNGEKGNFAAIKFDLDATNITSATLSFSHQLVSSWGNNFSNFDAEYVVTMYGFNAEGNATELGSWTRSIDCSTLTKGESEATVSDVSVDLALNEMSTYDSYGIIMNSVETSSLGGGAGVALKFTNIKVNVNSVPEPATASLSLLGLAALMIRRRR